MSKPIYIYEGGGSNPHIIGAIDTDKYSDHDSRAMYAVISKKVNNVSTLEVRISTNCEASKTITKTSDLVLYDTDGNLQEFHITDIDDIEEYSVERYIYAEQSIGELINDMIQAGTAMPTTTDPSDYLAYILSFTRWSVGTVDSGIYNSKWEEDLTGKNCLEALQMFIDKYNCEFEVRYTTDEKNKITGRYLDIKKTIGHNYGKRFEDDKDITQLKRNMDLDSVKTAIYPRIAKNVQDENGDSHTEYVDISSVVWSVAAGDPVDKPAGQTVLYNPQADSMYKRYNTKNGKLMDRIMYAEWTESTAKDAEDLCKQAWTILQANSVLNPTIELDASDLFRLSGDDPDYWHEQVALGDTCIIIAKQFDPELRVETRVMEMEEDLLNPINNSYTFGKYRKTLATSNIEQQKSIEEKLKELQNRVQGITIPESKPQYQSGRVYYEDIKKQVQNEFMSSSGYVMAQDADGFWVFDAPVAQTYSLRNRSVTTVHPTKATILKGGCLALAEYNTATSSWEIGTFINGTSVNADYINTGHLSGDRIEANSITADHLKIAAVEYIKNGLATEQDLQNVIDDIQANYATTNAVSNAISEAVSGLDPEVTAANAKVNSINISFDAIDIEYRKNLQQANTLLENSYLTGTTKTNLSNAKADYINKFTAVQTAKNDIVNNVDVSDTKMTAYNNALSAFKTSATTLGKRMEEAATAINSAVASDSKKYADGLKTSLDSEISDVSNSVSNLESTMNNAFKDSVISEAEAIAIQQQLDRLDTEKTDIDNEYSTLMYNSNLTGTAKTTLTSKYNAHATAYTNLVNAITNAIGDNSIDNAERTEIENCKTAYNTALGEYRTSAQSAIDAISSKRVENAMVNVVDSEALSNAINTAVQGLATEDYVNNKTSQAKDEATIAAQVKAITDLQKQLQTEYKENNAKANKVYSDKYLPAGSTAKTDLNNKISAYTKAYNNYNNYITTMLSDNTITNQEYSQYSSYADAYSTALKNLAEAMEVANSTRLENVYTQARAGLVTTAELEVNNESVIASAKAGMVSTADMTSSITAATENLVSNEALNNAINGIEVGGRNLLLNSDNGYVNDISVYNRNDMTYTMEDGWRKISFTNQINDNEAVQEKWYTPKQLGTYTFSILCKTDATSLSAKVSWFTMETGHNVQPATVKSLGDGLYKITSTYTITSLNRLRVVDLNHMTTVGATYIALRYPKLEIGSTATDWTPAPEDATSYTDNAVSDKVTNTQMNSAINNTTKDMATNSSVNTAISNATKDKVTNTQMNTAINNATEDMATNSSVNTAVSNATKDMATNAGVTNAINGVVVGSRNLALLTSDEWVSFTGFNGSTNDCRLSYKVLTKGLSVNDKLLVAFDYKLENMTYTSGQSPAIKIQGSGDVTHWNSGAFPIAIMGLSSKPANASGTVYIIASVNSDHLKNSYWDCNFRTDYITGGTVSIKGIRAIRSSKLVSWVAAPEDAYTNTVFETFKAVTAEYNSNYKIATTLYSNSYLSGTAKTNLKTAYDDYATKYNAVNTAHNDISTNKYADENRKTAWNTALINLQSSTTTLAQRVQEASTYINTAVYNASKKYTDTAIPDALTGYAKTKYVDDAKAAAIADARNGMVSTSQLEVNNTEILMKTASMGQYNILRNSDFRSGTNYWFKYDGSQAPNAWGIVNDSDAVVISGEKCMRTWITNGSGATVWNGFYQDVTLAANTSYTLSYWICNYNCTGRVSVWKGTANDNMLANKLYNTPTSGNHNRESWIYDSITFTTPSDGTYRMFFQTKDAPSSGGYGLFLIKPMLCTGINAQAWTAHPDEIHVGVVSVTEEKGIMVEHSDSDTHSTLDATGLKIWDNETNTPVASFGDGNEAYIGAVRTNALYADNVTPTIKLTQSKGYYYSNTGSGDFSGSNSDNCCAGFTAAMAKFCEDHNVDTTHIHGNFMLEGDYDIGFYCHGSTHDEDIYLENIYGTGQLIFGYVKNLTISGTLIMRNIQCKVRLFGNKGGVDINEGCIIKRIGARDGFYFRHCSKVEVEGFRFNNNSNTSNSGVAAVDGSNVLVRNCDIYNFKYGCYVDRQSTMWLWDTRGTSGFCGTMIPSTGLVIYRGKIPAGHSSNDVAHNIYIQGNGYRMSDYSGSTPAYSLQGNAPVTSKTVSQSYSAASYACYANYSIMGEIRQGSWNGNTSDWVGHVNFGTAGQTFLAGGSNSSGKIYLQRKNTSHGYNSAVPVIINGSNVGSLNRGEGKWFTLPASAINQIANGQDVLLNGKGNAQYIKFESNSVVTLTTTKSV